MRECSCLRPNTINPGGLVVGFGLSSRHLGLYAPIKYLSFFSTLVQTTRTYVHLPASGGAAGEHRESSTLQRATNTYCFETKTWSLCQCHRAHSYA